MFGAGLSEGILNHGLHAAWRSGLLCVDSADPKLQASLGPGLGQVAAKLGQPAGTKLSFALQLRKSPELRLNPGRGVELLVKELLLRLTMVPPDGKLNQTLVAADLAVGVKPWIDPTGNTVALDLTNVAINSLEIQNADGTPAALQLDPARLQRFISTVAIPALNTKLSGTVLSPAVLNVLSYQVELKSVVIGAANLAAYVNAYSLTPGSDKGAPETVLVHSPGQAVGPEVIRVLVRGSDNRTPAGLLRFKRRLDGAAWSEPAYGGRVDVTTPAGVHRLEIAAVDHDGNADPTPLMLTFKVDSVMPQLAITSRPETLLETDSASVTFAGRDDRTPDSQLQYTAQLLRVPDGGGSPQVVASKLMGPGERTAAFGALADGVYSIRIAVADAVGNVTSEDVGFVVAMTGGCSLGAAPGSSGGAPGAPLLLLALAALLWTRRCA